MLLASGLEGSPSTWIWVPKTTQQGCRPPDLGPRVLNTVTTTSPLPPAGDAHAGENVLTQLPPAPLPCLSSHRPALCSWSQAGVVVLEIWGMSTPGLQLAALASCWKTRGSQTQKPWWGAAACGMQPAETTFPKQ